MTDETPAVAGPARYHNLSTMLRRVAERHGDRTAIICGDTSWSYRRLDKLANRLASGLAARGILKGDRVAVLARNSHAFMALRFAVARLGAVLVPIRCTNSAVIGSGAAVAAALDHARHVERDGAIGFIDEVCDGRIRHRLAGVAGFVNEEPVAELGVVAVGVEQRVGAVGLLELGVGDRTLEPAVVGLASDLEHPARHRDGDPVLGQLADERVHHFPGRLACDRYPA